MSQTLEAIKFTGQKKNTLYNLCFNTDAKCVPEGFHSGKQSYLDKPVQQVLKFC